MRFIICAHKEKLHRFQRERATHLLLPFLKVDKNEFVVRKAPFGESQADTIGVGRPVRAIQSKSWHFRVVK